MESNCTGDMEMRNVPPFLTPCPCALAKAIALARPAPRPSARGTTANPLRAMGELFYHRMHRKGRGIAGRGRADLRFPLHRLLRTGDRRDWRRCRRARTRLTVFIADPLASTPPRIAPPWVGGEGHAPVVAVLLRLL